LKDEKDNTPQSRFDNFDSRDTLASINRKLTIKKGTISQKAIDLKEKTQALLSYHCNQIIDKIDELED
jgi:SUMO ligase MMS21 Smc5/6 complex component